MRSRHAFEVINFSKEKKQFESDLNPMSQQDNEKTNNFKSQHEKGSCDQESIVDKRNEVATPNAVYSKTARSRHGTEFATLNLLKGQKSMVVTKINIADNRNDVTTWN